MKIRKQLNELGKMATRMESSDNGYSSLCAQFSVVADLVEEDLNPSEWELVHQLYQIVSKDIEAIVKQEIASELLVSDEAPDGLVRALCNEEIDISGELLRETTRLADKDLIDIIQKRGTEHRVTIASRDSVSEDVSEALVDTAEVAAISRLLVNNGASIADESFHKISSLCASAQDLHEPFITRHDVPWSAVENIISIVSRNLVDTISKKWKIPHSKLAKIALRASSKATDTIAEQRRMRVRNDLRPSSDRAVQTERRAAIRIVSSLQAGDRDAAIKLLQDWSGLTAKAAATILGQKDLRLLATVYKAMGTEQLTFSRTVVALTDAKSGASEGDLYKIIEFFIGLDEEEAREHLDVWRKNPDLLQ